MVRRYAHLAPNHLTEHARKIDAIWRYDTNTTQGGNQVGLKLACACFNGTPYRIRTQTYGLEGRCSIQLS